MTFDEFKQQIIDYLGFEPGNPANYAYKMVKSTEEDSPLPRTPPHSTVTNSIWYYYDENDQLLYKVDIPELDGFFGGNNEHSPFPYLPRMMQYKITIGKLEYYVKRYFINDSVPTVHYCIYTSDYASGSIQSQVKYFDWQIE